MNRPLIVRTYGLFITLLLFSVSSAHAFSDTLQIRPNDPVSGVNLSTRIYTDTTDQLMVDQLDRVSFSKKSQQALLLSYSTHPIWLRVTIRQTHSKPTDYLLQLTNWFADYVDLYVPKPGGGYRVIHAGDRVPFHDREPKTTYPSAAFHLTDSLPHTLYIRVVSTQYHSYYVRLWQQQAFIRNRLSSDGSGFTLGIVLMRIAFQLALLIFMFRYAAFRGYSLHGLSVCLVYLVSGGNSSVLFPNSPYLANTTYFVAVALIPLALTYYVYELFDVRNRFPRLMPTLWTIAGISVAYLLFNLGWQQAYVTWFFAGFMAITLFFFSVLMVVLYITGPRPSLWYVFPLPVHLLPFAYIYARNAGFLPGTIQELQARFSLTIEFLTVPFFIAGMLRDAYRSQTRTVRDLALQRVEKEKLLEVNKMKTRFFTNVSHEFRTPLTLILGLTDELNRQDTQDKRLSVIQRNARRMLSLLNQLLDLGKLEAGQLRPVLEKADMVSVFQTLAGSFDSMISSQGLTFALTQNRDQVWAEIDRDTLEKIVTNLLSNAFKFTPSGGRVTMQVDYTDVPPDPNVSGDAPPATAVLLTVRDTGIGIDEASLPHIFDRFYQATQPQDLPDVGSGIGLALVQELVRTLGGSIHVSSEPGEGTIFTVSLMVLSVDAPVKDEPEPGIDQPETSPVNPSDAMLLIVDDNADIRAYVRSIFSDDYQIIDAEDGLIGLQKATEFLPDLVICDLMMPRLDGLGFCKALKEQVITSHIPVVMLTAKASVEERIEGFEFGADDYLTKPFNRREIQARVRSLIQQRQRLFQRFSSEQPVRDAPTTPATLKVEHAFLTQLRQEVLAHLNEANFSVEMLAGAVNMSRVQLHRKLKTLTSDSATNFIREIRLERATELLQSGEYNVTQVAYMVGFENLSYFAKVFQERYGVTPSQWGKAELPVNR